MNTRQLVDPDLLPMLDSIPTVVISEDNLAIFREQMAAMAQVQQLPAGGRVESKMIPGMEGDPEVRLLLFTPDGPVRKRPAMLHLHGGGFVMGGAADCSLECAMRAKAQDCVIAAVDYRLAPETPFPGPLRDCYAALTWLNDNADELGIDAENIAVSGASAGGGLAAALCLAVRDWGGAQVSALFMIYPMLDDRTGTDQARVHNAYAGEFMWTAESNRFGWSAMRGDRQPIEQAHLFSPARAETLTGMPPTFIAVGALDLFVDEDIEFSRRLISEGVPTELRVYPGAFHGFDLGETPIALRCRHDLEAAIARAIQRGGA